MHRPLPQFLQKCSWLEKICKNPDDYWFDEAIAFALAGTGFWYQLTHLFVLDGLFLNVVFFPLTCVEGILRWQVLQGNPTV
jgi:hypothetical protein